MHKREFPTYFYIQSKCDHGMVLEARGDNSAAYKNVVVNQKHSDKIVRSQLWQYDDGYFINIGFALVLDVRGGLKIEKNKDKEIILYSRKQDDAENQKWFYNEETGHLYPQTNPKHGSKYVVDIRGNWEKPGTVVLFYEKKEDVSKEKNQLWNIVACEDPSVVNSNEDDSEYGFTCSTYQL